MEFLSSDILLSRHLSLENPIQWILIFIFSGTWILNRFRTSIFLQIRRYLENSKKNLFVYFTMQISMSLAHSPPFYPKLDWKIIDKSDSLSNYSIFLQSCTKLVIDSYAWNETGWTALKGNARKLTRNYKYQIYCIKVRLYF